MGKFIKVKNKNTGGWDIISAGDAAGISCINPSVLEEGESVISVDEAVGRLSSKMDKLERNVSWLALYGGSGSGGGGGSSSGKVTITNVKEEGGVNVIHSTTLDLTLDYLVVSNRNNRKYLLTVILDGNQEITNQPAFSGTPGTLYLENISKYSNKATHKVTVMATDEEGINAESFILDIIESSVYLTSSIKSKEATIGLPFPITYSISNKVLGSDTNLIVSNITNGINKTFDIGKFSSADNKQFDVEFFSLFNEGETPSTGSSYTIEAYVQTTIGEEIIKSSVVKDQIIIQDGENLVVLVEGITTRDSVSESNPMTEFSQSGNISFSFTPYLSGVNVIYYSVKLKKGPITEYIGYFDESSGHSYSENQYVQKGSRQVVSWSIPEGDENLGDWDITLRCWSEKKEPMLDTEIVCKVVPSIQSLLPSQNPNNARFAFWDIKSSDFPQNPLEHVWKSTELEYIEPGKQDPTVNRVNMDIYNTNGELSGFLNIDGQNTLRLSGESYGIINVRPFNTGYEENTNWGRLGFTFSIAFKTDHHPFSDRTIFYVGNKSAQDESLREGIWVTLNQVVWKYKDGELDKVLTCRIQQNVVNTLDFVVDPDTTSIKIFVNGVLNVANEISNEFIWESDTRMYLACDLDSNGHYQNFADVNFYGVSLFRKALNDKQIVINSLNARAKSTLMSDGTYNFTNYNSWKSRNFFSIAENTESSTLWSDTENDYSKLDFTSLISDTNKKVPLPVLWLDCNGSGFTREIYEAIGANKTEYNGCKFYYYDPHSTRTSNAETKQVSVQIQGTSSTGYRSKNLEIKFNKEVLDREGRVIGPELFQPKETWMPENQFTLKADVVDSAHANNASIGKWINDNADVLFDKTPPMKELDAHRPVDTYYRDQVHDKVTIKHTLEGFPIILLITFDKESLQEMLGIYSFNLGRNSFYNMGFKFFKSFTTIAEDVGGQKTKIPLPAFVTNYETYKPDQLFGDIDQRKVYSYEFSENANTIKTEDGHLQQTALFCQDDISIIKHVGEFRYNGANGNASNVSDDSVWKSLQLLFTCLASMTSSEVPKYSWDDITKSYKEIPGQTYSPDTSWAIAADQLNDRFSIRNAYSYYMICIAFGLVDSLGKNMTLRSWNVDGSKLEEKDKNKWWPCFYDMDTATGLSNIGEENVKKTAYIDTFKNAVVEEGVNSLQVNRNDPDGGYDTYSSRLWDVLRDIIFKNTSVYTGEDYNELWNSWRNVNVLFKDPELFINKYFSSQTIECGELLFNYDYRVKYLTKYIADPDKSITPTYANITFLHGTRTEFVRDWLKKRYMFLDGVFMYSNRETLFPYNQLGTFSCGGALDKNPKLIVKTNCPLIFTVNIGQTTSGDIRYMIEENTPTEIVLMPISSFNMQVTINGISEISELEGLKNMRFQSFMGSMGLPSFSNLDMANVNTFSNEPINFGTIFVDSKTGYSEIRHIDLSNTRFWSGNSELKDNTFTVDISKYNKLKTLNISNSCVTTLSLPNASLSELNVTNSAITQINLSSQPFLETIDLTGCNKLQKITINNCQKIKTIVLKNLADLNSVKISSCSALESIECINNRNLAEFYVEGNCNKLGSINLTGCTSPKLNKIYLLGASELKSLNLSNTATSTVVELPSKLDKLTSLNLSNSAFVAFQYGSNPVPTYNEIKLLDLSKLISLNSLSVTNMPSLEYIKFDNNRNKTFNIGSSFFKGCANLKRVFGHIKLTGSSAFSGCGKFFIHELPSTIPTPMPSDTEWFGPDTNTIVGKSSWEKNEGLDTNITIGTSNLGSEFQWTSCNLYDVYYILMRCSNVTNLGNTFYGCGRITTTVANSLNRNMFSKCGKVTNVSGFLWGCGSLNTILYSSTRNAEGKITNFDGILCPLKNVTGWSNFISGGGYRYVDDRLFDKIEGRGATLKISSFSESFWGLKFISDATKPLNSISSGLYKPARASQLFRNLPLLSSIYDDFNSVDIEFDLETLEVQEDGKEGKTPVEACTLFYNNPKLVSIVKSFRGVRGSGSLLNVFGGNVLFDGDSYHFPQALRDIKGSFIFSGDNKVTWPIYNDMFRKIRHSLVCITGVSMDNSSFGKDSSSFGGGSINKVIYSPDGTDFKFPREIFTGASRLVEIPSFFNGLNCPVKLSNVKLPGDMFIDCRSLKNISYLFYEMKNIEYSLTGKGFRNCKLVNISHVFDETSVDNPSKKGYIPYGLFLQEREVNSAFYGWSEEDAQSLGIDENYGIRDGQWLPDSEAPAVNQKSYSINYITTNNTIKDMSYCLSRFWNTNAGGYTREIFDLTNLSTAKDLIEYNTGFNPVKYIKNTKYYPDEFINNPMYDPENPDLYPEKLPNPKRDIRRIILNPAYDKYKYKWNIWYYDGVSGLDSEILNSELYKKITDGTITEISSELPEEFSDPADRFSCQTNVSEKRKVMNYICPPDLFRYCSNEANTNISYALSNSGRDRSWNNMYDYNKFGIAGRIPPYLFEPVSRLDNYVGIFYLCRMLNPYSWPQNSGENLYGQMYSPRLFASSRSLKNISMLFANTIVPDKVVLPNNLFINNISLRDLDRTWMETFWQGNTELPQVPNDLFARNPNITNIRGTFASCSISVNPSNDDSEYSINGWPNRSPKLLGSSLFSKDIHRNIRNVSHFLAHGNSVNGVLPELWTWVNASGIYCKTPFQGISKSLVSNASKVPSGWNTGIID